MTNVDPDTITASAIKTLLSEKSGILELINALENDLSEPFREAVQSILNAKGRVIVTGVGKSGHIGAKIAATLASTGTPAFFLHAAEAGHGDLGMITNEDIIIALSWSGGSSELHSILNYKARFAIPLIAITSKQASPLGEQADICLTMPRAAEACPHNLAPTTSTTMQLAIGDALSISLLEARGFSSTDYGTFHPGGQLGARLKTVGDIMHKDDALPLAKDTVSMADAIITMSEKGFGCLGITNAKGALAGVITDGDLRRHMGADLLSKATGDVMTPNPITTTAEKLAVTALETMNNSGFGGINALFVVEDEKPRGIIHIHDLLRIGVA
ncbi:MAG: KpsF/GutQ family sugar-phosphate isomerase [Hyphomicrobiales bacterium]